MAKPGPNTDGPKTQPGNNKVIALPIKLPHNPVVLEEQAEAGRGHSAADRGLDHRFRGIDELRLPAHSAVRGLDAVRRDQSPWPTLTLIVSLEAIFLSTFVMIGQNRQSAFQQAKADHDFNEQELELKTNTELTREIHQLTTELHRRVVENPAG